MLVSIAYMGKTLIEDQNLAETAFRHERMRCQWCKATV